MIKMKFSKMIVAILLIAEIAMVVWFGSSKTNKVAENVMQEVASVEGQEKMNAEGSVATISTENWDLNKVHIEYDSEGVPVPVPNGYVGSSVVTQLDDAGNVLLEGENTVNDGFVIYEGTEAVTVENREEAQTTRNQWVWVPIYDPSEIYGIDSLGMMHGKLYDYNEYGRTRLNWSEDSKGVMKITSNSSYREPAVVSYDYDAYLSVYNIGQERDELKEELTELFEDNIESIKKYGGFYIGRYETGRQRRVVKGNLCEVYRSWYEFYKISKELSDVNENITTNMIWGCMWDATLEWLVDSGDKTYNEVGVDSTSWSYCSRNTAEKPEKANSGYSEMWKANNIYDLAGNFEDATLEAYGTSFRTSRAGKYSTVSVGADHRGYFGNR